MQLRRLTLFALAALALGACGRDRDDGPDIARPDQLQLRIVSGDRQRAPVASPSGSTLAVAALAQAVPDNVLPEPLVARITINGQAPSAYAARSSDPLAPSFAVLPSNTAVTFRVIQPQDAGPRHCGDSFLATGIPDDSGYVTTYWERGTYAGECRMEVRLVVDGQPRVDTVFVATFDPGELATWAMISSRPVEGHPGDTLHLADFFTGWSDRYGNPIPVDSVIARESAGWAWRPYECTGTTCTVANLPEAADSIGWNAIVPAEAVNWPKYASRNAELCIWLHDTSAAKNRTCFGMHIY